MEAVPVEIGGILALGGAYREIEAVIVEVNALGTGMVEYTVQNDAHPQLMGGAAQTAKICFRTQQGVDLAVIGGIVAVVGGGLKNGVEIQGSDAHGGESCQLGGASPQRAAEKVTVADLAVRHSGVSSQRRWTQRLPTIPEVSAESVDRRQKRSGKIWYVTPGPNQSGKWLSR